MNDTTLFALASGTAENITPALDDLRLQADQALLTNWEHGRALHTMIDAVASKPDLGEVYDSLEGFAGEFSDGCAEVLTAFDDGFDDLQKAINSRFDYLDDETPTSLEEWPKELVEMKKKLTRALVDFKKQAREAIEEHHNALRDNSHTASQHLTRLRNTLAGYSSHE